MASTIADLLEREFLELERQTGQKYGTQKDQAKFLDLSPSYYSKVLRWTHLSRDTAERIASALRRGERAKQAELVSQLMGADDGHEIRPLTEPEKEERAKEFRRRVTAFFSSLTREESKITHLVNPLLLIEYRDMPRAESESRYPDLQVKLAEAVVRGACVGLFQPFGPMTGEHHAPDLPRSVHSHRAKIIRRVERVWRQMSNKAHELARNQGEPAAGQLVLYTAKDAQPGVTGLQTRMFYANYWKRGGQFSEVWEWTAGDEHDTFIKRDSADDNVNAFRDQFFPIPQFWLERRQLPTCENDLLEFCASPAGAEHFERLGLDPDHYKCPWIPNIHDPSSSEIKR